MSDPSTKEPCRIAPELVVRLYSYALYCTTDSGVMNAITDKFIRRQRSRRRQKVSGGHSHGLAVEIAKLTIDQFFWELVHPDGDHYPCRAYDADWLIDDLLSGIDAYFSDREMDSFYMIADKYWALVRSKKDSERFTEKSLVAANLASKELGKEIRGHQKYSKMRKDYSLEIADRIFHDRQISYLISEYVSRSYKSSGSNRKVNRIRWPSNIKRIVFSRDRGKCAKCHCDIAIELLATAHLDHIIAISNGGSNDHLNLQLLCSECNLRKGISNEEAYSSVPKYHRQFRSSSGHLHSRVKR